MKKNVKRILSFVLMAVMVFALLPVFGMPIVVKADDVQEHDHSNWVGISSSKQLIELGENGGNGYLVNDIEISKPFSIHPNKTVNLCLNGKSIIQTADYADTITISGTLNLYDESKEPGKITHNNATRGGGVFNFGTFTMNGGTISGNNADYGGGVFIYDGTFTMNGGTISGNNATYGGGGVINNGTFTMEGGTISGNKADYGGGVENNNGTFTMKKGTVSENEVKEHGGGVYNHNNGTFTMEGGTISGNEALYGGGVENNSGTFTMKDGTISENKAISDGKIDSYGGGVYNGGTFTMEGGTISENKAISDGKIDSHGGGVYNSGTFTMEGGTISENKAISDRDIDSHGGGVYNSGTFTMKDGTISNNEAKHDGGGVYNKKTFKMEGGTISGNNANYGGGVENYGTFTMMDGTISRNNAGEGGGVFNNNKGTFTMTEGTISGNEADYGGGVEINNGTFTMTEGTIKDNTASKKGSGVFSNYSFVKEGGDIEGSIECLAGTLFTVTFNPNGGSNNTIIQYVVPNVDTNLTPNKFSYVDNRFECWKTKSDGSGETYEDEATICIDSDLVLYTKFVDKISYKVNFKVNNGSWSDGKTDEVKVNYWRYEDEDGILSLKAEDIPTPENPNKGYKAGSWDAEPETEKEKAVSEDQTDTYTYTFAPIEYTIKYDSNGGTGTMDNQSRKYDDKAALTANAFTYEGKTFDCWNTAADGSGKDNYSDGEIANISDKDNDTVTLYAQWTTNTFTVSWKNYDGTVLETDKNVAYGSTPSYDGETPVRAKEGNMEYTFSGWTPEVDTVKGAATYTATYSEKTVETTDPSEPQDPEVPAEPDPEIPAKDWLDDLRLALRIADELDGPQTVEYSGDFALSYDIMEYLKEHTDITLVYHVTYEGVTYTVTIPAGRAIADANIGWYGPLWLLANYGGDNVPEIIAGSGKYTVVAGDTLSAIAEKFGVTVDYLAKKNGIKNPDYIIVGQVIVY